MSDTITKSKEHILTRIAKPEKYNVVILNDAVTPIGFVIEMLMRIFHHDELSATDITLQVHKSERGVAGVYHYEIAEQKTKEATAFATANGFPLVIKVEPA